jgi:DNA-binding winged helix-turn-helix (wHTH) protein
MKALLAVKAHKARCLKILAVARKALEAESDKLIHTFSEMGVSVKAPHSATTSFTAAEQPAELQTSPGQPSTLSPTESSESSKHEFKFVLL